MQALIERPTYMAQLLAFKDTPIIKVVTGIRRCGKSTLFDLYSAHLQREGVDARHIIRVNLEDPEIGEMDDWRALYDYVKTRLVDEGMHYIFIDEVQMVPDFQRAVDGLFIKANCDVYVTGSNAFLLSGELATLLSGRYVEIRMLPLSFKEYVSARQDRANLAACYRDYIQNGAFPYLLNLTRRQDIRAYLESIYTAVVLKDIVARRRIADVAMLERVISYMFDNIGNLCSATKIANTLTSAGRKISVPTVESYLTALTESFILYKANRYDAKGKQLLTTGSKYYLVDVGLRYYLLGSKQADQGHILENVVYLELLRRGHEVFVGKVDQAEIDFVAIDEEGTAYYQVALTVLGEGVDKNGRTTLERELAPLEAIRDHNPKYLLTMDYMPETSYNGIKQLNVLEWLLDA